MKENPLTDEGKLQMKGVKRGASSAAGAMNRIGGQCALSSFFAGNEK